MNKNILLVGGGFAAVLLIGVWLGMQFAKPAAHGVSKGASEPFPYQAGPFQLAVDVEPEAPVVGENRLRIRLRDSDGEPVEGADVRAVAEMPAMGAMPAMQAPAEIREIEPGVYAGSFELSMQGGWPLSLTLRKPGLGKAAVGFDLATGRRGLELASGASRMFSELAAGTVTDAEEAPPGTIMIDARRRQLIGVTTAFAEMRPLTRSTRAVGRVVYDETRLADVSLKYEAWIGELKADFVGVHVNRGDVLFTVYSPDLYAAQQEYVETFRRSVSPDLLSAARQRLAFWDVDEVFVRELEQRGEPVKYVPIRAPQSGTVVMKNVVEGTAHRAGMTLLRIADLSRVWVEAEVYEADLPSVSVGMSAAVTLPYLPGTSFRGKIDYVYPYLQGESRTAKVRLSLPNPDGLLKPDMFADVTLETSLGERLVVPESAVIVAGEMRVVFEDLGDGRLAPHIVKTGHQAGGWIEVTEGLNSGDCVVTSGNFLIASESRLKAGIKQW